MNIKLLGKIIAKSTLLQIRLNSHSYGTLIVTLNVVLKSQIFSLEK